MRRVPAQARSRERLERILDAAEAELGEVGYDAATMQAIAERAGTSIGSVYQFFPNKKTLIGAITERYVGTVRDLFGTLLSPEVLAEPWSAVLDRAIEALFAFSLDAPAFRALWLRGSISPELIEAGATLNRELAERVELAIAAYAPQLTKKKRNLVATVVVEAISAMIFVAGLRGKSAAKPLMEETKVLLRSYLAEYTRD
jgi:AcrR family transcriptional regulator